MIKILWIEDSPEEIYETIKELESFGFHVTNAKSVKEAFYESSNTDFDIIITDLLMPPPDGIDFLEKIRFNKRNTLFFVYTHYPYNDIYRDKISNLNYQVEIVNKKGDDHELTRRIFESLIRKWDLVQKKKKIFWKRIIDAIEIKPGFAGIAIDLKKLTL